MSKLISKIDIMSISYEIKITYVYRVLKSFYYCKVPIRSALPNRSAPKWVCTLSRNSSAPHKIKAPGASNTNFTKFIHTCTVKHGTCCSKSKWWPPNPVSLLLACLNQHMSKHTISAPVMPKMARNRRALRDVLAPVVAVLCAVPLYDSCTQWWADATCVPAATWPRETGQ